MAAASKKLPRTSRARSGSIFCARPVESTRSAKRTVTILRSSVPSSDSTAAPQFGQKRAPSGSGWPQTEQVMSLCLDLRLYDRLSETRSWPVRSVPGGLLPGLGVANAPAERLEHAISDFRIPHQKWFEVPLRDRSHHKVRGGNDSRAATSLVEQGHLTEVVAGAEHAPAAIRGGDLRLPIEDDHEAHTLTTSNRDLCPPGVRHFAHLLRDLLEIAFLHPCEELHGAQIHGGRILVDRFRVPDRSRRTIEIDGWTDAR